MKFFAILRNFTLFALAVCLSGGAFAQKMKVGYWTSGFSLGFGAVMEQMKFAEKEGVDVEWVKFSEVNGPTRALPSHAIDLAFGAPSATSMAIASDGIPDRKSTRLNSSHSQQSRMPSSA